MDFLNIHKLISILNPNQSTNVETAETLCSAFYSFHDLLASKEHARTSRTIRDIQDLHTCFMNLYRSRLTEIQYDTSAFYDYIMLTYPQLQKEHLRLILLDQEDYIMFDKIFNNGAHDRVPVCPEALIEYCQDHGSFRIVLIHNHPAFNDAFSLPDKQLVRHVKEILRPHNGELLDLLLISERGIKSLRPERSVLIRQKVASDSLNLPHEEFDFDIAHEHAANDAQTD